MGKKQKLDNPKTTISVMKTDKVNFRKLANMKGRSKLGDIYESDTDIFTRIVNEYVKLKGIDLDKVNSTTTYPVKP